MVPRAMRDRWTEYGIRLFCLTFFFLVLEIHGCWSLSSEGLALLKFREKVDYDPFGALANWNASDCDPCKWPGVDCVDGKVHTLDLHGEDLEGALAPELGNLAYLRLLDLSKNRFSGNVPPQLGQLTALEVLDLTDNELTGTIPAELGGLHSLKLLLLSNNRFVGSIPAEIRMPSLLTDLPLAEVLTDASAGIGSMNRKFGRWFEFGSEASRNKVNNIYISLKDVSHNVDTQANIVRRILVEHSSNLDAAPSNIQSLPVNALPSRSSGSFPAIPKRKKPSPAPAPSLPIMIQHKHHDTTNPGAMRHSTDRKSGNPLKLIIGISSAVFLLAIVAAMLLIFRSKAARTIGPWKTGLSGQLQKAFVTGVPKLNRAELEIACEDFSNIICNYNGVATIYKGTLSSGVEIAVASTTITSLKDWSTRSEMVFRKKIDTLSQVNHKNFVNLIGYCEEDDPFTRMMVFEYAPNGTLFEHLHVKEVEHLDWQARMRIVMGTAYCLQYMHDLNPPIPHSNLNSEEILLTEDYAAKIGDFSFWAELIAKSKHTTENESDHSEMPPLADVETNIQSFGILLLEIISGKHTHTEEHWHLVNWATQYLNDKKTIAHLIDPTLESFEDNELEVVCEVIQDCIQRDPRRRPTIKEVIQKLRGALAISPDAATPSLSPLWWAELEILSAEGT